MANNKDFKVKNGIQPTAYHEAVGTTTVSTETLDFEDMYYSGKSLSVTSQETTPYGLFFKSDGLVLFLVGPSSDTVFKYNLGTAWDISTASYSGDSFSVASAESSPRSIFFKSDGTKMYIVGTTGDDVNEYSLSTAWDITTASYTTNFSVSAQTTVPIGLFFKSDGTKMYITLGSVWEYNLSTAWDISTASYSQTKDLGNGTAYAVFFKSDGTELYAVDGGDDRIYRHTLSTAWDVSTASYTNEFVYVGDVEGTPHDAFFKPDLSEFFLVGNSTDSVLQYTNSQTEATLDLSTGNVFELTPTSDIRRLKLSNPAASGTVSQATLLLTSTATSFYDIVNATYDKKSLDISTREAVSTGIAFNTDGTKMFICGSSGDEVNEFSLSTAWDITTASYTTNFSVSSQLTAPEDITFKPDGTKMYLVGRNNDIVCQYSLSTAYDISTASYDSVSLSVSSQDAYPTGLRFSSDGTKMYVIGDTNDSVYQYTLTTAYDLSTASYASKSFSVTSQEQNPSALAFNDDGTKLFIIGRVTRDLFQYTLSTAWDISTASYDSVTLVLVNQAGDPAGMTFSTDGDKLYIIDYDSDLIYQYSTDSGVTVTYDSIIQWPSGTAPAMPDIGETDVITISTRDGGTTYKGIQAIDGAK